MLGGHIVVELIGGIEPARALVPARSRSGADVITGNKALLASHGPELFEAAEQVGAQLYYEAAVAGAIPIIRPLRESLAGDRIVRVMPGIVNGTTNFILDRMDTLGESLRRRPRHRDRARLRRGRPDGRRRGRRRRAEGHDPGEPGVPHECAAHGGARRGNRVVTPEQIRGGRKAGTC